MLNLIDRLPRSAELWEEVAQDDELARSQKRDVKPRKPRVSEWSLEVDLLARLHDLIGQQLRTTVQVHSKSSVPKMDPYPRPFTAADRAQMRQKDAVYEFLQRTLQSTPGEPEDA